MRSWVLALLGLVCLGLAKHVDLPPPYEDHCIIDDGPSGSKYDPTGQFRFPWFDVNLDEPPSVRWQKVSMAYAARIKGLIDALMDFAEQLFPGATIFVDTFCDELADKLQQPYRDEIISVSKDTGIGLGRIVLYNIFYEVFTVCTSIVATDSSGNTIHARNLDFGLFLGWNASNHDWIISDHLRQIIVNVNWIKDGKVLYKSNHFAGYIGVYNAMKRDAFSITTNSRFMAVGGIDGIIRWMLGLEANGKWMSWLIRETMEFGIDYEDAKDRLMNIPMLSPVYYVLGGSKPYQGAIITRALDSADYLVEMDPNQPNGWYVLQTNYDDDDPSEILYLDDRDTPGRACMNKLGQANANFEGLYNVLSSRTNLNKLTTYTVLMSTQTGAFETHLQGCPGLCWPV